LNNTVKALIVVVVILLALLGVAVGFILGDNLPNTNKNTTVINQTNVSVNNTTAIHTKTTTNVQKKKKVMISASEAEKIATKHFKGYHVYGSGASLSQGNGHPIWIVSLKGDSSGNNGPPGYDAGQCAIDATTGEFLG
jgi:uncharacterized membrane protein YkoI